MLPLGKLEAKYPGRRTRLRRIARNKKNWSRAMLKQSVGKIGGVEIGRVLDSSLIGETMQAWFPDFDREAVKPHEHWLCPRHYDAESGHFNMPCIAGLLCVNGHNVLIDTCMGKS